MRLPGVLIAAAGATLIVVGVLGLVGVPAWPLASDEPAASPGATPTRGPLPSGRSCRSSLQAEVDASSAGAILDLTGCSYTGGATIDRPMTVIGATVRIPRGQAGIVVEADDVTLDGLSMAGTQAAAYDFNEIGVLVLATPDDPVRRLIVRNSELATLGGFGTYLRNVVDVRLIGNDVHDIVYAGLMVLSGAGGTIEGNVVRRIGTVGSEANDGNAYGIAITSGADSEPVSSGFLVAGNVVEDVPTWHALDTHAGREIVFRGNVVRRSMRGIFLTTDGSGREPTNIAVIDNHLLSPAPVATNLAAVTLYRARTVAIIGNTARGWGRGAFLRDFEDQSTDVVVDGNTVVP